MTALTPFQCNVLSAVQEPLPLCDRPFEMLAETLGVSEQAILDEIARLKSDGFIRRYRSQFRYRALGRTAVLAAAAVPEDKLEQTAALVSGLSGVSHNYQRAGDLNLWFTLQGESMADIDAALDRLRQTTGLPFYSFPAETVYKLDVRFDPAGPGPDWFSPIGCSSGFSLLNNQPQACASAALTVHEKQAIAALQRELPLVCRPFDQLFKPSAGQSPLSILKSLSEKGVLNKIAAVLNHTRLGYTANVMLAAVVAPDCVNAVGSALARIPAVTHCYRRRPCPEWPCTLYAMFHADTFERIADFARSFAANFGIADCRLLPTVREFKKTPVPLAFNELPPAAVD